MSKFINGWTRESFENRLREKFKGKSSSGTSCYYRHPDGVRQCVVGCFINDDDYDSKVEGLDAHDLISALSLNYLPLDKKGMLYLQSVHDYHISSKMSVEEQIDFILYKLDTMEK